MQLPEWLTRWESRRSQINQGLDQRIEQLADGDFAPVVDPLKQGVGQAAHGLQRRWAGFRSKLRPGLDGDNVFGVVGGALALLGLLTPMFWIEGNASDFPFFPVTMATAAKTYVWSPSLHIGLNLLFLPHVWGLGLALLRFHHLLWLPGLILLYQSFWSFVVIPRWCEMAMPGRFGYIAFNAVLQWAGALLLLACAFQALLALRKRRTPPLQRGME